MAQSFSPKDVVTLLAGAYDIQTDGKKVRTHMRDRMGYGVGQGNRYPLSAGEVHAIAESFASKGRRTNQASAHALDDILAAIAESENENANENADEIVNDDENADENV